MVTRPAEEMRVAHTTGGAVTIHLPMPAQIAGELLVALAQLGFELLRTDGAASSREASG